MRNKFFLSLIILLLFIGNKFTTHAQSRTLVWKRWDVQIFDINTTSNRYTVTETYDIDFTGRFSFGSAIIPNLNLEQILGVQVFEDELPLRSNCDGQVAGTFCAQLTSDGLNIVYYFTQPIIDSSGQFKIRYDVMGALRIYDGGDQLWWSAIPAEHFGFPINASTITVSMPSGYAPREGIDPVETYGVPATLRVAGGNIVAVADRVLTGDESFEIRVQYPHDPNARKSEWQSVFDQRRAFSENTKPLIDLGVVALSLLLGLGGILSVYALWYTKGRDPKIGPVPAFLTEPPTDLRPAVVGTLLDEKADLRDVIAILIDLARRGYLVMEENQTEGLFGIGQRSNFVFKRTDKSLDDLVTFEKRLMTSLFATKLERTLESLGNSFYVVVPLLQNDLYKALVEQQLFTTSPQSTRTMWTGISILLLVVAGLCFFAAESFAAELSGSLFCLPIATGIVGFAALFVGRHMPAKTRTGTEVAAKWRAFREYLIHLEKYANVDDVATRFDEYLGYAIVFGIDRIWVRRFSQVRSAQIPPWYFPTYLGGPYHGGYVAGMPLHRPSMGSTMLPGELASARVGGGSLNDMSRGLSGGLENISNGLSTMLESAGRIMTSQPQPSGSSGRWSSGGRSWSGGGGFRGGGSGGGSRGFG
ncbi:MAG: DUF2207 domain-containing protein [Anaerolineae bacterium]